MKITYIITAYNAPEALERLINKLKTKDTTFIVHIDTKSKNLFDFNKLQHVNNVNILSINEVDWGGYSMVDTELKCCEKAIELNDDGFCILLSGSDYPVKSNEYIQEYLEKHNLDFITGTPLPHIKGWLEGGRRKIECYALRLQPQKIASIEPHVYNLQNIRQFIKVLRFNASMLPQALKILTTYPSRRHPSYLKPYGGETWWGMRISTIKKILRFVNEHPDYCEWQHDTMIPEEMFMNTLVYNICKPNEIRNSTMRYVNWKEGKGNSPGFIGMNRTLINSLIENPDYLFARKIRDKDVSDYIDNKISH